MNLSNKRGINESFKAYKKRLKSNKAYIKKWKKGKMVWLSKKLHHFINSLGEVEYYIKKGDGNTYVRGS